MHSTTRHSLVNIQRSLLFILLLISAGFLLHRLPYTSPYPHPTPSITPQPPIPITFTPIHPCTHSHTHHHLPFHPNNSIRIYKSQEPFTPSCSHIIQLLITMRHSPIRPSASCQSTGQFMPPSTRSHALCSPHQLCRGSAASDQLVNSFSTFYDHCIIFTSHWILPDVHLVLRKSTTTTTGSHQTTSQPSARPQSSITTWWNTKKLPTL